MKVLVCDPISEKGIEIFQAEPRIEVDVKLKLTEEQICEIVSEYSAIVVRSETKITKKIIDRAQQLKVIGRAGVGIDNIDVDAATKKGIVVVNTPDGNTIAATEHTVGMMLALARHIPQADQSLRRGEWNRSKFTGIELRKKTLGIMGFGKIGSGVGRICKAMGIRVLVYDPYVTEEMAKRAGVEQADFETVLRECDIITFHLPLTSETKHLITKEEFRKMKDGVKIINVARGGLIDEKDLYDAIKSQKVSGAALDVYEKEPQTESPLFELPQVIVTPHLGASTKEAQVNVAIDVAEEMIRVLKGEPVQNAVNIPFIKPELLDVMKPYMELVEKLGRLASALAEGPIDYIEIKYFGEITNYDLSSLTNTFIKGLLRPFLHDAINYVNAPLVAKSRGIAVKEIKTSQTQDYTNKICVTMKGNGLWSRSVAGTVFKKNELRILNIDEFSLDIQPRGHIVLVVHKDRPKMVGRVGMILGDYDINIAGMQLDRLEEGGKAMMILTVDQEVGPEVMEKISQIPGCVKATAIAF